MEIEIGICIESTWRQHFIMDNLLNILSFRHCFRFSSPSNLSETRRTILFSHSGKGERDVLALPLKENGCSACWVMEAGKRKQDTLISNQFLFSFSFRGGDYVTGASEVMPRAVPQIFILQFTIQPSVKAFKSNLTQCDEDIKYREVQDLLKNAHSQRSCVQSFLSSSHRASRPLWLCNFSW